LTFILNIRIAAYISLLFSNLTNPPRKVGFCLLSAVLNEWVVGLSPVLAELAAAIFLRICFFNATQSDLFDEICETTPMAPQFLALFLVRVFVFERHWPKEVRHPEKMAHPPAQVCLSLFIMFIYLFLFIFIYFLFSLFYLYVSFVCKHRGGWQGLAPVTKGVLAQEKCEGGGYFFSSLCSSS